LDRKSLLKLWEEDELRFGGRSQEELDFYADKGFWPEQRGRLHYSMQGGKLFVEWQNEPAEESVTPRDSSGKSLSATEDVANQPNNLHKKMGPFRELRE
jgi:hypothetical protein